MATIQGMSTAKIKSKQATVKPTGLTISRSGYVFTCQWKIGDKNYTDGQQFQYRYGYLNDKFSPWQNVGTSADIGKTVVKKTITINPASFYPSTATKIKSITFRVRGNREEYNHGNVRYQFTWSDWAEKTFVFTAPPKPTISSSWSSDNPNRATFSWSVTASDSSSSPFYNFERQTALVKDTASPNYGTTSTITTTNPDSQTITEDSGTINDGHAYKRIVRIRTRNCFGVSDWVSASHVYSKPYYSKNLKADINKVNLGYDCILTFNTAQDNMHPIDRISAEYLITVPDAGLTCPTGLSWEDGATAMYKDGSDRLRFSIDNTIGLDEVLYVRVNTEHDNNISYGAPLLVAVGNLTEESGFSVTKNDSTHKVTVNVTNNSDVPDSRIQVRYKDDKKPNQTYVIGIIPHGQTSAVIQCPVWQNASDVKIGVRAFVGGTTVDTRKDGTNIYTITQYKGFNMWSAETWSAGLSAPTNVTLAQTSRDDVVKVSWQWSGTSADGAEISWADHDDAWQSTEQPETYSVSSMNAATWHVAGLEVGKRWYFRVRYYDESGSETVYSQWSSIVSIDLSTPPAKPTLRLSKDVMLKKETVTASWNYESTDGTKQTYAEICQATVTANSITYGKAIASTKTGKSINLSPSSLGWTVGTTYALCVRVTAANKKTSEWSDPAYITVARELSCSIQSSSLVNETIDGRSVTSLQDMPLTITVSGALANDTTTVAIERADSYYLDRPDEDKFTGQEGETIALHRQLGSDSIVIDNDDLIGQLDDGAPYRLVATVSDIYGQVAKTVQEFEVHWSHQAIMPEGVVVINEDDYSAQITPQEPTGAISTDRCDIYRLSADKPELIYKGAEFGETYVDPYPAFGEFGGHRIVFRTKNGDYITEDNHLAWIDIQDGINAEGTVINFEDYQVHLDRNFDVSNSWEKDFEETIYLGGSVQGDWNPGISRTASVSTAVITITDQEEIKAMRRLAVYSGICHVRTEDGSSFKADVQVSESRSHDNGGYVATYSISITRVDSQQLDGMTLEEWEIPEEE